MGKIDKKMMYQTFSLIIGYLIISRKISVDFEGKIGWIYYPENTDKKLKQIKLFWKNGKHNSISK